MPLERHRRPVTLVVDSDAAGRVLRKVGPSAWAVLHALACRTSPTGRGHQADTNVRELASELGISKDTVARAVNKLIAAKLIRRSSFTHDEAGRFATRTYNIDLATAGIEVMTKGPNSVRPRRPGPTVADATANLPPPPPPPPPPRLTRSRSIDVAGPENRSRLGAHREEQPSLFGNL